MDWMWGTVLPDLQSVADRGGFGAEWRTMCVEKSLDAARDAGDAARSGRGRRGRQGRLGRQGRQGRRQGRRGRRLGRLGRRGRRGDAWERYDPVGLLARLVEGEESS